MGVLINVLLLDGIYISHQAYGSIVAQVTYFVNSIYGYFWHLANFWRYNRGGMY